MNRHKEGKPLSRKKKKREKKNERGKRRTKEILQKPNRNPHYHGQRTDGPSKTGRKSEQSAK